MKRRELASACERTPIHLLDVAEPELDDAVCDHRTLDDEPFAGFLLLETAMGAAGASAREGIREPRPEPRAAANTGLPAWLGAD